MKFGTVFAIVLSIISIFGIGMAVLTIAMLSAGWENECHAPLVANGLIQSDGTSFNTGDQIDPSLVSCDTNYHLNANSSNFVCKCTNDGGTCEELKNACVAHLCSTPNVISLSLSFVVTKS